MAGEENISLLVSVFHFRREIILNFISLLMPTFPDLS